MRKFLYPIVHNGHFFERYLIMLFTLVVLVMIPSCEQNSAKQKLFFEVSYNGNSISCQNPQLTQTSWQLRQLQFFLSEIKVKRKDHPWQTITLVQNPYQSNNLVLLGEHCGDSGNWQLISDTTDFSQIDEISFTLGIPFALNHQNPLTQASPLNVPSMFWVWQNGHKFMRLELSSTTENWAFHLGSTGCQSIALVRAPKTPCKNANRFTVKLKAQGSQQITLDLAELLKGIQLNNENSCQSAPDNPTCELLFQNLTQNSAAIWRIKAAQVE